MAQIDHAVEVLGQQGSHPIARDEHLPASYDELNLKVIPALAMRFNVPIGYSGHETGIASSVASVALGATMVERHLTLDRAMWGSDQAASLRAERHAASGARYPGWSKPLLATESKRLPIGVPIMEKLRRVEL